MKKSSTILLLSSAFIFIGCSDSATDKVKEPKINQAKENKVIVPAKIDTNIQQVKEESSKVIETKKAIYTIDEIYSAMCIQCHSSDGSGNTEKLTPSMTSLSQEEIKKALIEVEEDKGHIIMEHNRGEILKLGMEYSAKDMASYMYNRFHK